MKSALVARNSKGQPESVHYEMVNAMLLNELLKEHCKNEEQGRELQNKRRPLPNSKTKLKP